MFNVYNFIEGHISTKETMMLWNRLSCASRVIVYRIRNEGSQIRKE